MSKLPLTVKIPCWLLSIVLGVLILVYSKDFLLPIVLAALLSLLLYPVFKRLTKWKLPTLLAVFITMLVVVIVIAGTALIISKEISLVVTDIYTSGNKINEKIASLHSYIATHFNVDDATITNFLSNSKDKLLAIIGTVASGAFSSTTGFMGMLVIIIVYVFCFLLYNRSFHDFAYALMGNERHDEATTIIGHIQKLVQHYLLGLLTVILIIGTCNSIGLFIIGVNHALFFAFFAAMLTVIPYIGIFIGASLPVLYVLLTRDTVWPAVGVLGVFLTVQFLESNFITPKIVGSRVSVNPFVAIVALLVGAEIWGLPGMLLSIPMTAILKLLLDLRPQTRAIGYFLGSEFTDTKNDPFKFFGKKEAPPPEHPKK
jgi:predicted PurR-regulated permease PerM